MYAGRVLLLFASFTVLTLFPHDTEAAPNSYRLVPNGPPIRALVDAVSGEPPSCQDSNAAAADTEFEFDVSRESRVRVSVGTGAARSSSRVEIFRDGSETIGCSDAASVTSAWIGMLAPGHYSARLAVAAPTARRAAVSVRLEVVPPPKRLYDVPLSPSRVHPMKGVGDTFRSDALVKLSCTEEGAPTELFALPVSEKSSFVFWIPPEIDDESHVFAILRAKPDGYDELGCGHQLSTILERGRYLFVAAGASGKQVGSFRLAPTLRSLAAEDRAMRNAPTLALGSVRSGSTRGGVNAYEFCDIRRVGHAAPDRIFRVVVPRSGELSIAVEGKREYSGWLTIRDAKLDALEEERSDCTRFPGVLHVPVATGTYYVIVDGIGVNAQEGGESFAGDFTIRAELD
jgi:hypothetical protein